MPGARPYVVVVGGANADVKARSSAPIVPGTSNPGTAAMSAGGVGRNIAENLARLGTPVHLVSAVGRDDLGDQILATTAAAGVIVTEVARVDRPTGSYTSVLDSHGELFVAIADMSATDLVDPPAVRAAADLIRGARLVVVEANLQPATIEAALAVAGDVPVVLDTVSVPKATRLRTTVLSNRWHLVAPNRVELAAVTGMPTGTDDEIALACGRLHDAGVTWVWVHLGAAGSLLSGPDTDVRLPARPATVVDTTGAGDSMLAAWCHGVVSGRTPIEAARLGHAAASLTVADPHTVVPHLTADLLDATMGATA